MCNKDIVNKLLKQLEEKRNNSKINVIAFSDLVSESIKNAEKVTIERLDERHKKATSAILDFIKKVPKTNKSTKELGKEGLNILKKNFVPYEIRDNSEYVFNVVRKSIHENIDCSSLETYVKSIPHGDTVKTLKEFVLSFSNIYNYARILLHLNR